MEIGKCNFLMPTSTTDFAHFSSASVIDLFFKGRIDTRLCLHSIFSFPEVFFLSKILSYKSLRHSAARWGHSYIQFPIIII